MLYPVVDAVLPPLFKAIWRPAVEGLDHIPAEGPLILASNHLSFADSVVIPVVVPRKVVFMAKSDYFTGPGLKGRAIKAWFEMLDMIPVDRDDNQSALAALDIAMEVLERGEAFGVYPEGTRSRDGRLYRGRTGVAQLALVSGAPIVPVGLIGTERLQPVGTTVPRIIKVQVRFGAPIEVAERYDGVPPGKARRDITDEVMSAIQRLSGQELAGVYNERPAEH